MYPEMSMETVLTGMLKNLHVEQEENNSSWICTKFPLGDKFCEIAITIENHRLKNARATLFNEGEERGDELELFKRDCSAIMFDNGQIMCPLSPP